MLEEEKKEELLALLTGKKYRELKSQLVEMNEVDIASFIEELDSEKTVVVFRMLPKELASEVFACLEVEQQQHIITSITDNELRAIIDDLYVDDAVDMLEELPATIVRRVLQNSSPDTRKLINQFLNYPENSAGSVMTAELTLNLPSEKQMFLMLLRADEKPDIRYEYPTELEAPVHEGQEVGQASYYINDEQVAAYPIYAAETVEKIDYGWCLRRCVTYFEREFQSMWQTWGV